MENILTKIPTVGDKILKELDNKSLVKFKKVKKSWYKFVKKEKVQWIRIIQNCIGHRNKFSTAWAKVLTRIPIDFLKQISISTLQYQKECPKSPMSPIHVAISNGSLELYKHVIAKFADVNL